MNTINESSAGWDRDQNGKKWEDYDTIVCPDGQIIDMAKLLDEQQRAKAALLHIMPHFGGFINKLKPVYTFRVKTQAVDGFHIFINPQFTANLDLSGKVFLLAHEIMHCVLNHLRRGRSHDRKRSNIAADYEVNTSLVDLGLFKKEMIDKLGGYIDMNYASWGYEKIYADAKLNQKSNDNMNNEDEQKKAQQNNSQRQSGGSSGSGQQSYSDDFKKGWAQAMEDYKNGKLKI